MEFWTNLPYKTDTRMRLIILLLILINFGCAKKEDTNTYLKQEEIPLVQPRVEANNTIIDSTVTIQAELRLEGTKLYYTTDNTEPTEQSTQYTTPLITENAGTYKFKAFHNDWKPSESTTLKLYKKGIALNNILWHTQAHNSYPGLGEETLINNKKASKQFRDSQWVGFDSIAKATINFEKETFIKTLTIGFLIDTKSWIFPPSSITLVINKKDTISVTLNRHLKMGMVALKDLPITINKGVTSITVTVNNTQQLPEWHPGKGLKAWLFMDEWIFN